MLLRAPLGFTRGGRGGGWTGARVVLPAPFLALGKSYGVNLATGQTNIDRHGARNEKRAEEACFVDIKGRLSVPLVVRG